MHARHDMRACVAYVYECMRSIDNRRKVGMNAVMNAGSQAGGQVCARLHLSMHAHPQHSYHFVPHRAAPIALETLAQSFPQSNPATVRKHTLTPPPS